MMASFLISSSVRVQPKVLADVESPIVTITVRGGILHPHNLDALVGGLVLVARGIDGTFMWLVEEIGELAAALREGTREEQMEEFADVLAWLTTIANVAGVDLTQAVSRKYGSGCPGCGHPGRAAAHRRLDRGRRAARAPHRRRRRHGGRGDRALPRR